MRKRSRLKIYYHYSMQITCAFILTLLSQVVTAQVNSMIHPAPGPESVVKQGQKVLFECVHKWGDRHRIWSIGPVGGPVLWQDNHACSGECPWDEDCVPYTRKEIIIPCDAKLGAWTLLLNHLLQIGQVMSSVTGITHMMI